MYNRSAQMRNLNHVGFLFLAGDVDTKKFNYKKGRVHLEA